MTGRRALTLFIHDKSRVGGDVRSSGTPQLFLYKSTVDGAVRAHQGNAPGFGHAQVCGAKVGKGISIRQMGPDVLVGDPSQDCAGNTVREGSIVVENNVVSSELVVRGNTVKDGGVEVDRNTGPAAKFVQDNHGSEGSVDCSGNSLPFTGVPNSFPSADDQCS